MRLNRSRPLSALAALVFVSFAPPALAQQESTTGALERFAPSAAGDALFGVPSAGVGGHLIPRGKVVVDYNYLPLSIQQGDNRVAIVSHQTFLHLNASLPIFDRVLFSIDM